MVTEQTTGDLVKITKYASMKKCTLKSKNMHFYDYANVESF